MKDGAFCLSESAAILRYLARKEASKLYPDDIELQARIDQWTDYVLHHVRRHVGTVHFNRSLAPLFGREGSEDAIAEGLEFLEGALPVVETALSESPFLCGDQMSLADIALVSSLEPIEMSKIDISAFPALSKWLKARRAESFYTNVHSHYGAELGQ